MKRTKSKKVVKSKGNPDGAPRYKSGKFPVYDSAYEQAMNSSPIFNEKVRSNSLEYADILHNLVPTLRALIGVAEGKSQGHFKNKSGNWQPSYITHARQELAELHQRFKDWSMQQVREGKAREPAKEWPSQLLELKLKKEALLDVRRAEAHHVKNLIEERKAQQEKKHIEKVLPLGPLGKIENDKDGNLTSADGQRISYTSAGLPVLDEPTSPYHKMAIVDYRVMCAKWMEDMGLTREQLHETRNELYVKERKEALARGEDPPTKKRPISASKMPWWMDFLEIDKTKWPEWPENVKPVK